MGYDEITAERQKHIPLLKEYMCRLCKKFKDPSCYSNKELNTFRWKQANGQKVTKVTAELRCRNCAGAQRHELKCLGNCGMWRDLQQYSKSARAAGGSGLCHGCTLWKEAAEAGIVPQAAPLQDLAPDEDDTPHHFQETDHNENIGYYSDPEAGHGSDDDDDYSITIVPYSGPESHLTPLEGRSSGHPTAGPSAPASSQPSVPTLSRPAAPAPSRPSVRSSAWSAAPASSSSFGHSIASSTAAMSRITIASNSNNTQGARLTAGNLSNAARTAPHLRSIPGFAPPSIPSIRKASDMKTVSSASNPYDDKDSEIASQNGRSAVDAGRGTPPAPIHYNAWDSHGVQHIQQRFISDSQSEVDSTATTTTNKANNNSNPAPPSAVAGRSAAWAKPIGSRNAKPKYDARDYRAQPRRKQNGNDSDDEM